MKRLVPGRLRLLSFLVASLMAACAVEQTGSADEVEEEQESDFVSVGSAGTAVPGSGPSVVTHVAKTPELRLCLGCGPLPDPWKMGPLPDPWTSSGGAGGTSSGASGSTSSSSSSGH